MITAAQYRTIVAKTQSESDIQISCVRWFRGAYPQYSKLLVAIPNGGSRSKRINKNGRVYSPEGKRMKAEGIIRGTPDLFLAKPSGKFAGLWIEMKRASGTTSADQIAMMETLSLAGYCCKVCRSVDEFEMVVKQYLNEQKNVNK